MRPLVSLIYLALCLLLSFQPPAFAEGSSRWLIRKEGDHFSVETQAWVLKSWASRSHTLACAKQLEAVRENLFEIFGVSLEPRPVLQVLILEDRSSFLNYSKEDHGEVQYMGGYWSAGGNQVVTWDRKNLAANLAILSHELTHYFVHQAFPRPPLWLDEGLAEYISASQIRWGKLRGGYPNEDHLKRILDASRAQALIPLRRLVGLRTYLEGQPRALQYSQCWGLVYFFFHGSDGRYASSFLDYMTRLRKDPQTPFEQFFNLNEIEQIWVDELEKTKVGRVKVRSGMRSVSSGH